MRHLANAQYWDQPAGGNTGRLFLAFGGLVCADQISNCPLDTYKNLIYLLNLQFSYLYQNNDISKCQISSKVLKLGNSFQICYSSSCS